MKTEITHRWRVQDGRGRWYTTRWNATEADIRRQHPEAVALAHTRTERQVPETADELWARGQPGLSCVATSTPDSVADRLAHGLAPYPNEKTAAGP